MYNNICDKDVSFKITLVRREAWKSSIPALVQALEFQQF